MERGEHNYDLPGTCYKVHECELVRQQLGMLRAELSKARAELGNARSEIADVKFVINEQSKVVTKLCLAIDPDCQHGPDSDKIADYAKHLRKTALEAKMGVILKCAHCNGLGQVMRYRVQDHIEYEKCDKCDGSGINDDATAKIFNLQSENEGLQQQLKQAEDEASYQQRVVELERRLQQYRVFSEWPATQMKQSKGE